MTPVTHDETFDVVVATSDDKGVARPGHFSDVCQDHGAIPHSQDAAVQEANVALQHHV